MAENQTAMKFIVDYNSGGLVKWLRMLGYDTVLFTAEDDRQMIRTALREDRVILTRDTQVMKFGLITSGKVQALYIISEQPEEQIRQVVKEFQLDTRSGLFTLCLECNRRLEPKTKEEVRGRVPPYVFKTQEQYLECPNCGRIYWRGTHWGHMMKKLGEVEGSGEAKS